MRGVSFCKLNNVLFQSTPTCDEPPRARCVGEADDCHAPRPNLVQQTEEDVEALTRLGRLHRAGVGSAEIRASDRTRRSTRWWRWTPSSHGGGNAEIFRESTSEARSRAKDIGLASRLSGELSSRAQYLRRQLRADQLFKLS